MLSPLAGGAIEIGSPVHAQISVKAGEEQSLAGSRYAVNENLDAGTLVWRRLLSRIDHDDID
jgi:hypothetical protein